MYTDHEFICNILNMLKTEVGLSLISLRGVFPAFVTCEVLQGSVLGPILFAL